MVSFQNYQDVQRRSRLKFPRTEGRIATVVVQDHGEMFGLWSSAARSGTCPMTNVSILHIDKVRMLRRARCAHHCTHHLRTAQCVTGCVVL